MKDPTKNSARIRDKPGVRIDRTLYAEVCKEAATRQLKKTPMLESLIRLGFALYSLRVPYEPMVERHVKLTLEDVRVRQKPSARLSPELYAEICEEAIAQVMQKTQFLELCVKIGLANLRHLAAVEASSLSRFARSRAASKCA